MNDEAKKLQLIEKLLAVSDKAVLAEVEAVLLGEKPVRKESFKNYIGTISNEDLTEIEKFIEQGCEQINTNDWK